MPTEESVEDLLAQPFRGISPTMYKTSTSGIERICRFTYTRMQAEWTDDEVSFCAPLIDLLLVSTGR
jgi:hypothetical protein